MLDTKESNSPSNKASSNKINLGYFLSFTFALGAFVSGWQLGSGQNVDGQSASLFKFFNQTEQVAVVEEVNLDEFWRVWDLLDNKFATGSTTANITSEEKFKGAINGLVGAYDDPYTVYLPPVEATAFDENISGNFSGVGMEVGIRDSLVTVIAPLAGTPAEQSGIVSGDVIVKIDDVTTEKMRIDEAVKLIRGEKGTVVNLEIFREGEIELLKIPVTRDTIDIPTVKTELIGDTFIISLYSFNAVAEAQTAKALQEYLDSGSTKLVLDLRDNPGGFLQSAVSIAGYFLPAGKIVVKEQFGDSAKDDVFRSRGRQVQLFNPDNLVVLVNNGSASASEILAGALKDHGVSTTIGTQTFGKGSVQELIKLDNGSSLKVTVARWLTPNNISISDGGLTPDIAINRTPAQRFANEDPQKDAAIRFLKGENVVSENLADKFPGEEAEEESGE